ncbi:MAG: GDP-mannose 4,6-dehydratase [Anaerolineae bacterium]|nr:GDP-mannose 4,6-dehydratase [Anaerolineae bacterium]MDW8099047.1 GDP-mannose 4,6-dehydratase [Anaerolineae bacterium]
MDWTQRSVLVTGAGGFIGSHLVEALVCQGAKVTAFLHYNSRNDLGMLRYVDRALLQHVRVYFGDLRDIEAVRRAMTGTQIVFHLGALIGIPYSYVHPQDVVQTNVIGTLNVLLAARDLGVERVVHTSTSEVYGTAQYVPIDENHPLQGQSPYAASKIGADKLVESFYLSFGLPISTVRPFNTYGPRQSARAVIPTIIVQALTSDRLRLGALHPTRDFNYVTDTVKGFIAAAMSEATIGEVVNIGSGQEISIGDLARKICKLLGREFVVEIEDDRLRPPASEVERLLADNSKAQRIMNWAPEVPLEKGLEWTIEWIKRHLALYHAERYVI